MALSEYKKKRKFSRTPEPKGGKKKKSSKKQVFVMQKHDASHLHYDLRLEIDRMLKSWAVPKGPSLNPKEKRLAIETEDHPLEYRDFEGVIPEGEYGAGTVMVWDKGIYENISKDDGKDISMKKAYSKGHIVFRLKGKKLKGGFSLVRFRGEDKWLLVKKDDEEADARVNILNKKKSAKSGKTMRQIEKGEK